MHCFINGSARVIFQIVAVFRGSSLKGLTNSVKNIFTVYLYTEKHDIFPRLFASLKTQSTGFCRKGILETSTLYVPFNIVGPFCSDSQVNSFITLTQHIFA